MMLTLLPFVRQVWEVSLLALFVLSWLLCLNRKSRSLNGSATFCLVFLFGGTSVVLYLRPLCLASPLSLQLIWLLLFLLWHIGRHLRLYWLAYLRPRLTAVDSSHLRIGTLRQEYRRFDRILIYYCAIICTFIYIILLANLPYGLHWGATMLVILSIWVTFVLELTHLTWIRKQLHQERWISVLGTHHEPIDRVPLSVGQSEYGRMPLIRLILWSQDMIYLEATKEHGRDTPFIGWLFEGEGLERAGHRLVAQRINEDSHTTPRLLLSYQGEWEGQSCLIHLLALELSSPQNLRIDLHPREGKWWSMPQIDHEAKIGGLRPTLHDELPYLKETMLLAHRLHKRVPQRAEQSSATIQ